MQQIELADAVIAVSGTGDRAVVRVFKGLDRRANAFEYTWGACESVWRDDQAARFRMLFEVTIFMLFTLRIPAQRVARALRHIRECRGLF